MTHNLNQFKQPIDKTRVRSIAGKSFGYLPHRFLKDGFLTSLNRDELALYVFLILVANQWGVSFYGYDSICTALRFCLDNYLVARNGLIQKNLIAFDGVRFQVLELPKEKIIQPAALKTNHDFTTHDPATIRTMIRQAFPEPVDEQDLDLSDDD